jgi:16S rRNA (uracil1498-N3)-methyltransferase
MQRYFTNLIKEKQAILKPEDHHHIKHVMRFKVGDEVSVCDLEGHCYLGTFQEIQDQIVVSIANELPSTELPLRVSIGQALIRKDRFEYMLQKATELGMHRVIPLNTKYSIVDLDEKKAAKKRERWQKIVLEASEQSRRNLVPSVEEIIDLKDLDLSPYDAVFVAYEQAQESKSLHQLLETTSYSNILLLVGPEGGFHPKEIERLKAYEKVHIGGLGKRILRSETASSYFLSVVSYVYELGEHL